MAHSFSEYAKYYDLLYQDKDYQAESFFVDRLLQKVGMSDRKSIDILDLACGTGRHSLELALMGYRVEGSDLSADMIKLARENAARQKLPIRYHTYAFQTCAEIARQFDAIVVMFAAIDYLTNYRDLSAALQSIRKLLKPGGVFIFDFWNGNAVVTDYSQTRTKQASDGDLTIIRKSNTTLHRMSQIATVTFNFKLINDADLVDEFEEVHSIRYFYPQEMVDLLAANGFKVIHRCQFMAENLEPTPADWSLTYVAQACD